MLVHSLISWIKWRLRGRGAFDPLPIGFRWAVRHLRRALHKRGRGIAIVASPTARIAFGAKAALRTILFETRADLVYCDTSTELGGTRSRVGKPEWAPQLLLSGPYPGPLFAVRKELPSHGDPLHQRLLKFAETDPLVHHERSSWAYDEQHLFGAPPCPTAAERILESKGHRAEVSQRAGSPWCHIVLTPRRSGPIDVVIPTTGRGPHLLHLLEICIADRSISTTVVADTGCERAIRRQIEQAADGAAVEILDWRGPFNFSAVCNAAVKRTSSDLLLFLNDDVAPRSDRWLRQLAGNLDDPTIAAAGPLLVFPDGRVQSAGVDVGAGGVAADAFRGVQPDDPRCLGWPRVRREVSALTAACLLMRREAFDEVGGFDEDLPLDYQDVDLCLRLTARGWSLVVDPAAVLVHEESVSRGRRDADPRSSDIMIARWGTDQHVDRFQPTMSCPVPSTVP